MTRNTRLLTILVSCLVFFLLIQTLISHVALSSFSSIRIEYGSDRADRFMVYYSLGSIAHFSDKRLAVTDMMPARRRRSITLDLHDRMARKLRLDPGSSKGRVWIYRIILYSHFGPPIVMGAAEIHERFRPNEFISGYRLSRGVLEMEVTGKDPRPTTETQAPPPDSPRAGPEGSLGLCVRRLERSEIEP